VYRQYPLQLTHNMSGFPWLVVVSIAVPLVLIKSLLLGLNAENFWQIKSYSALVNTSLLAVYVKWSELVML